MPPQPLSKVRSKAKVFVGATVTLQNRPLLGQLVAHAIAIWADIDNQFGLMLATMLGANAAPAAAMFQALNSSAAQIAALDAAAVSVLGPDSREYVMFKAVMRETSRAASHRNRLAHWCWAHCTELPEALLLIPPETLMAHDMADPRFSAPFDGHALLGEFDRNSVLVYWAADLREVIDRLQQASYCVSHFRMLLIPHLRESDSASEIRDQAFRHLEEHPRIAQALSRIRARQHV